MTRHILIVGGAEVPEAITRELDTRPGWESRWVPESETAIEAWMRQRPDAVILSDALDTEATRKLAKVFEACEPGACVFTWTRGQEAALVNRLDERLRRRQLARLGAIRVTDTFDPGNLADSIRLVS